ncbi:MAG: S-adenosylmethionine:tRNA ribosyltransferase-isomerase [Sphingobacteriales bacterium]|nr:S-adenosylmethionine:tRNA ribosyltransferase-isomerase [Sphingobacteriales bacterium]OJW33352.1 MAG: S-adenosylmethionine tRNA ribosyltransferase [Sphingobacteriales bacterium 46-32]
MHPRKLSIADFTYDLPAHRIAHFPLEQRDASRLLIYRNGITGEDQYRNIAAHLPANSLLVFNDTRVIEARLLFQKATGGLIEIFCLEPGDQYRDINSAMQQTQRVVWKCMVGGASKWKPGQVLQRSLNGSAGGTLEAVYLDKKPGYFLIGLSWTPAHLSFAELLHQAGAIPLPPYIKRKPEATDAERYQTVYARQEGSVAAPTAGLHFTPNVFQQLRKKEIECAYLTLHVGAGTFQPVKAAQMADHEMHAEFIDVNRQLLQQLINKKEDPVVAVGTTSLRTLESLYWLGVNWKLHQLSPENGLTQWEVYDRAEPGLSTEEALTALLEWMQQKETDRLITKTRILIAPGYKPRVISALITNFHQPQSTLLLLVAALAGNGWRDLYNYALEKDFRFLSYGDGCLIWVS